MIVKSGYVGRSRPNKTWTSCVKEDLCERDVSEEMTVDIAVKSKIC